MMNFFLNTLFIAMISFELNKTTPAQCKESH